MLVDGTVPCILRLSTGEILTLWIKRALGVSLVAEFRSPDHFNYDKLQNMKRLVYINQNNQARNRRKCRSK